MKAYRFFWGLLRLNQLAWITTLIIILMNLLIEELPQGFWIYQAYALLGLGILQLVSSIVPFLFGKVVTKKLKSRIYWYWIAVVIHLGTSMLFIISKEDQILSYDPTTFRVLSISVAMILGGYLIICLHQIKKSVIP